MRVTVNHSSEYAAAAVKQPHRVLSNVFPADVQPPEGVSAFFLDSVLLSMDIFDTVKRERVTIAKRLKTSVGQGDLSQATTSQPVGYSERETLDELLLETEVVVSLPASSPELKRNRSIASALRRTAILPISPPGKASKECRLTATTCGTQDRLADTRSSPDTADLHALVDGALRLSVMSSINSKSLSGIRIKANTFRLGLAEIAPTLWRPGYLLVRKKAYQRVISDTYCTIGFVPESKPATCY